MKIVFDARVHLNYYSGISRYIICLLEAYSAEFPDDEIHLLLNPTIQQNNSIYSILGRFENIKFHTINRPHMGPRNYVGMKKIIADFKADVYHYPHLDAPIKIERTPTVATIHDANYSNKVKKFNDPSGLKKVYFKYALKSTLKHAQKVIFVSNSVKTDLSNQFGYRANEPRFTVMHNGIEEDFNQIDPTTIEKVSKELKLDKKYLLYVGQIREHKNVHRIMQAFKALNAPGVELIMAGHNYLNEVIADDQIRFLNEVSNSQLKVLYHQCHAVVFPSLFEGFGFPIIEGFSFGKNVITTNYGATKEVGGSEAILVDPLSIDSIKEGMKIALEKSEFESSKQEYVRAFSWKSNAHALRKIYEEAISSFDS